MSSRDMTLTEFKHTTKAFDDSHTVRVSDLKAGGKRITAAYVLEVTTKLINELAIQIQKEISDLRDEMRKGFAQVNARIDNLEKRIDNLVAKNNLKE